mgnify:CR=1 FL=1
MEKVTNIEPDSELIRKRYETLLSLYNDYFINSINDGKADFLYLSKELLHCAVNAYFDDIYKYKAYAGSKFADRHKQLAYTMIWISRFKPIQLKEGAKIDTSFLTINESFAIFAGLIFLDPSITKYITQSFYKHLVYTLTYRNLEGRGLASLLYVMEAAAKNGVEI